MRGGGVTAGGAPVGTLLVGTLLVEWSVGVGVVGAGGDGVEPRVGGRSFAPTTRLTARGREAARGRRRCGG